MQEPDQIRHVIEEVMNLVRQLILEVDSDNIQKVLNSQTTKPRRTITKKTITPLPKNRPPPVKLGAGRSHTTTAGTSCLRPRQEGTASKLRESLRYSAIYGYTSGYFQQQ